ncbi:uncharacterized protein LOC129769307 [Toxorhynchites rutilus septentrionalis]|uniref:uncharacterized protein LOC129769307 n=1 Tax=Toxorhynchites rutilus septentrionalis TaxID=329112 RepID=UPI002479E411|nr:uncharacterized protein LOC129769307 [Toxorhynchites rutilus septentrionalis]
MVVPIRESQDVCGNKKRIRIDINRDNLQIIGNQNRILVKSNEGTLNVIGNLNNVKIMRNYGKINYVGNEGSIYLSDQSKSMNVSYTGNNARIRICDHEQLSDRFRKELGKEPRDVLLFSGATETED